MRYRPYTSLQLQVSEIAFGTGDNAGGMVHGTPAQQRQLVGRALELGINLFDTSPAYGRGVAEKNLGRVLREVDAKDVFVATKVKIMPHEFGEIAARTSASIDESLRRLGRDYVDFLLVHNPCRPQRDPGDEIFVPLTPADILGEMLPALLRAKIAGKVRCLGLACDHVDVDALRTVLNTRAFELINAVYHLTNPSAARAVTGVASVENYQGLFELAARCGASVAVISPLAGGALTSSVLKAGVDGLHGLSQGWFRHQLGSTDAPMLHARRFQFLDRPGEQSLAEAAYRFILSDPRVATIIGGFSHPPQIDDAAGASDKGALAAADAAAIEAEHLRGF